MPAWKNKIERNTTRNRSYLENIASPGFWSQKIQSSPPVVPSPNTKCSGNSLPVNFLNLNSSSNFPVDDYKDNLTILKN